MSKKDFTVIILGSDENAYGNARLVYEEYNIKPILMCSQRLIPTYYSNIFTIIETKDFDKSEIFVSTLKSMLEDLHNDFEKVLVVPCADYYTELLANNYGKFDGLIANQFISKELMEVFNSKNKFYELCEKYGLDYPKTYVANKDDRISAVEKLPFDFPIVAKPENSNSYDYVHAEFNGKKKVYYFSNKEDYLKLVESMNMSKYDGKLIIQEFIAGSDETDRVVNSYSTGDAKVIFSCLGQPVLEDYAPAALGNYSAIISRYDKELYEKVQNFLEAISYKGFSNIDFKYDKQTKKYLAFELNPRLGRSSFFVYSANINIMKMLIDDVVYNKKIKPVFNKKEAIWLHVPKKTIKQFINDENIKKEIFSLMKKTQNIYTLKYKKDNNFMRRLYVNKYYNTMHKNFCKYYFEKDDLI